MTREDQRREDSRSKPNVLHFFSWTDKKSSNGWIIMVSHVRHTHETFKKKFST